MGRRRFLLGFAAVALVVVGLFAERKLFRWKKFSIVEAGSLYRSGMMHSWQLDRAIEQYKIKTVFSFTFTHNEREAEQCSALGVDRHFHYLSGDGVGTDDAYFRFLEVVQDRAKRPVLVHCSAGVQRTGGAVALYRVFAQGWSIDDAIAEMIAAGNDGNGPQIEQLRRIGARFAGQRLAMNSPSGASR